MAATKPEQEQFFNDLLPKFSLINDSQIVPLKIPYEEATSEGERVLVLIKEDDDALRKTGIDPEYLDSLAARVGAFVWSVALLQTYIDTDLDSSSEWKEKKPKGILVRKKLLRDFEYAFRNNPKLMESVANIKNGKGNKDYILDLMTSAKLGKDNIDLLKRINADISLLDQASDLYNELTAIYAHMTLDPKKRKEAEIICNKAWTYLKEALDEIYLAGRYAFDEDNERHALYYNDYFRRIRQSKTNKTKENEEKEETISA